MTFHDFFQQAAGFEPYPFQEAFPQRNRRASYLCNFPTGAGKTELVTVDWLWGRFSSDPDTPRRLAMLLPLRTLVEQTFARIQLMVRNAEMEERIRVYKLLGGAVENDFDFNPAQEAILIGTQYQILSRQLMRGYACPRPKWPKHFAYLHNDCRIICDETQLMGAGLLTTAILQEFREQLGTWGNTQTIWMSATLDSTVMGNSSQRYQSISLTPEDWAHRDLKQRLLRSKPLCRTKTEWLGYKRQGEVNFAKSLAPEVLAVHQPGTLTLIVLNTVGKARALYRELRNRVASLLLHSRFRPFERESQVARLVNFQGIAIATQVVEAGIDLDARVLFTELAPWASMVQRLGRCGRRGTYSDTFVYWIAANSCCSIEDLMPYDCTELEASLQRLSRLTDAGISHLLKIVPPAQPQIGQRLTQQVFTELFDTTPSASGMDIDIAPYVRVTEDLDVFVAWRNWDGREPPLECELHSRELCRVSVRQFARFPNRICWVWNGAAEQWQLTTPAMVKPSQTVLLPCNAGGYSADQGWTGIPTDIPLPVTVPIVVRDSNDADGSSFKRGNWYTLRQHSSDTASWMCQILNTLPDLQFPSQLKDLLERAARWHDLGKAHPVFQQTMCQSVPPDPTEFWAKSPHSGKHSRKGFRHELASALAAMKHKEPFLLVYLVACHHGKVRLSLERLPWETQPAGQPYTARGVIDGEILSPVDLGDGFLISGTPLQFPPQIGAGSWREQVRILLRTLGKFRLAYLETLIRNADEHASAIY